MINIIHPEGTAKSVSNGLFAYQYNATDHLGNIRVVVNETGEVQQSTDYYPFGLAVKADSLNINKYLYNGKEIQDEILGATRLDVLDFGARLYDPISLRFQLLDPKATDYYPQSPYVYAANNPILYIDENGEGPREFFKAIGSSFSAAVTLGVQGGVQIEATGRPAISLSANFGSKDLIGIREGEVTHIGQKDSPTRYGTSIGYGGYGTSNETEVVRTTETEMRPIPETNGKLPVVVEVEKSTETVSVSVHGVVAEGQQTTEIRTDKNSRLQHKKTTEPSLSTVKLDIGSKIDIKASVLIGIDISIDLKKIIQACRELNN